DELALEHSMLRDILESKHRPDDSPRLVNRRAVVFDGKVGAVLFPEDVIRREVSNALLDCHADWTDAGFEGYPFAVRMPKQFVLMLSLDLLERPAGHLFG